MSMGSSELSDADFCSEDCIVSDPYFRVGTTLYHEDNESTKVGEDGVLAKVVIFRKVIGSRSPEVLSVMQT